jgi:hypothetical protein
MEAGGAERAGVLRADAEGRARMAIADLGPGSELAITEEPASIMAEPAAEGEGPTGPILLSG